MKHYIAREVRSSGRLRIDVALDHEEIATFYPERGGARLWQKFQDECRAKGDMLTLKTATGGFDIVGRKR